MKYLLLNPAWSFEGSIYFGCREPHLPLEFGYSQALLKSAGHDVLLIDAQMDSLTLEQVLRQTASFEPDFTVITTAPSYLFWRCAPPELRIPLETLRAIRPAAGVTVVVGPHASTTPASTLRKLETDVAILGECEEILPLLANANGRVALGQVPSIAYRTASGIKIQGNVHSSDMNALPALEWPSEFLCRHRHHHHRFDSSPAGPGAEMETSRGCPYHCTFCAKDNFRNGFRRRPVPTVARELDALLSAGVEYIYFIDEIFLPYRDLLEALALRAFKFGIQTRIDLWKPEMLDLLARAGCVSIEAGVESITESGRELLDKRCKMTTVELADRLIYAKSQIPFVQANLLESLDDNPEAISDWRRHLQDHGVWSNEPVPLFPYPGSPDYTRRWGAPDDSAWERAHDHYLGNFSSFSDIQEQRPERLVQLELA